MSGHHLAKTSDGNQTTFELCGPVASREVVVCYGCGDPIWGKVYEIRGRKTCGRCFKDNEREKAE
jgi:hypothetical protein